MGEAEVIAEQKKKAYIAYVRLLFEKSGEDDIVYTTADSTNIIKRVDQLQEPYREQANILLSNASQALTDVDLRGYKMTIGFGFVINGSPDYINQAPMWVVDQQYDSRPGKSDVTIVCQGIMSQMDDDRSDSEFEAPDDMPAFDIVKYIIEATLAPYDACQAYTVDWSTVVVADDINFFYPGGNYKIYINSNRLKSARNILDNSYLFPRPESDGNVHLIRPTITGVDYDYVYELAGDHKFYINKSNKKLIYPNYFMVYGGEYDDETQTYPYSGNAENGTQIALNNGIEVRGYEYFSTITSDDQCDKLAAAILQNITLNENTCQAVVPMNCTAKLFDYCKIIDSRNGNTVIGNLGHIRRNFESGVYRMSVKFGGWANARKFNDLIGSIQRSPRQTQEEWISVSTPEWYMVDGTYIDFHRFNLPNGRTLLLKSYSLYSNGDYYTKLSIRVASTEYWYIEGDAELEESADVWKKLYAAKYVYANNTGSTKTVSFRLSKTGGNYCYANAMIVYAIV